MTAGSDDLTQLGGTISAAQYVRMSTEHQKYSTAHQKEAIGRFAIRNGLEVVRTYADEGKSGLTLDGREALSELLADVQSGHADYSVILVYDVSRWGRFQDIDESAYYEHICKREGIKVRYCAELFENDGSPISNIVKTIKRAMAAEYSRELSAKVFAGLSRLVILGYYTGGPPGFGLRRMVVDDRGRPKGILKPGEYKAAHSDRTLLVPGPKREVKAVQWIFTAFVQEGLSESKIAAELNRRNIRTASGQPWTIGSVNRALNNERYIGHHVWNRTSLKLGTDRTRNREDMWIKHENAFEPIVERSLFEAAQRKLSERTPRYTEDEMLEALRSLLNSQGYLTSNSIDRAREVPCSRSYHTRFGSLRKAYELVGYDGDKNYRHLEQSASLRSVQSQTVAHSTQVIEKNGGSVEQDTDVPVLSVNNEIRIYVCVARCRTSDEGTRKWLIRPDEELRSDLTLVVRMDSLNRSPLDYFLFPTAEITFPYMRLRENNWIALEAYRTEVLDGLFQLTARTNVMEVMS